MDKIEKAKLAIDNADYILIGAGAGLSTAAGLEYGGERFENKFKDFIDKYGLEDMYSATFYPFKTSQEKWGYLSRHVYENRYSMGETQLHKQLYELVKDKDYFVITTNVDKLFDYANFDSDRIFEVQGDYGKFQCSKACHDKLYYNESEIREMVLNTVDCKIPKSLIPICPLCGSEMDLNIRKNQYFVEDENWHRQSKNYQNFLNKIQGSNIVLLEFGVGYNTPIIIRFPFEQITYQNDNATLIRFNKDFPQAIKENKNKTIGFSENINEILPKIIKKD